MTLPVAIHSGQGISLRGDFLKRHAPLARGCLDWGWWTKFVFENRSIRKNLRRPFLRLVRPGVLDIEKPLSGRRTGSLGRHAGQIGIRDTIHYVQVDPGESRSIRIYDSVGSRRNIIQKGGGIHRRGGWGHQYEIRDRIS